jgi:hypothetical protein
MSCTWDGFCWGMLISAAIWAFVGGMACARSQADQKYLRAVLFVIGKLHQRGVYLAPFDIAVINVAIDSTRRKWWQIV